MGGVADDIVLVVGARPNFMKVAPVLRELQRRGKARATLVYTGQHRGPHMCGVFFEQLGLPAPDIELDIGGAAHGVLAGPIMEAFHDYLAARPAPPQAVVVVGDVTSTMACALVAAEHRIPVAHVEAGLRSFDRTMPEEVHRIVTDSVSSLMLASEPAALANLAREGVPADLVHYCGNVMIDTLVEQLPAARALDMPARVGMRQGGYAIATLHRPSNVDSPDRLRELLGLLLRLGNELPVLFPVHPRTANVLGALGLRDMLARDGRARLLPPLGYRELLGLLESARLVLTDSGGIQEETTYLGVSCITLRASTERPITLTHGTNTLAGTGTERAFRVCTSCLRGPSRVPREIDGWDGRAAARVVDALERLLAAGGLRDIRERGLR
jgi:UDP-N-acetylglucosamine 2-epimerase (non-hydrolysing)